MTSASIEAMREICDVLDTLVLAAKLDHAPRSKPEQTCRLQACVDKFDQDDPAATESRGLKAKK
jgi:hypothetical protein